MVGQVNVPELKAQIIDRVKFVRDSLKSISIRASSRFPVHAGTQTDQVKISDSDMLKAMNEEMRNEER